jgi:thiamine biosynthesis lipoprotein
MFYLTLALLNLLSPPIGQLEEPSIRIEREAWIMGTSVGVVIEADSREFAIQASEKAILEMERVESLISTWKADSELSSVNRASIGVDLPISDELFLILAKAEELSRETRGSFSPFIGPLIEAWDLRGRGRIPASEEIENAIQHSQKGAFKLNIEDQTVTKNCNMSWIETGAFGKGVALYGIADVLGPSVSHAEINFGGQVWIYHRLPYDGPGRVVQIAHPSNRSEGVLKVKLINESIATSGMGERFIEVETEKYGHIIDPHTGMPAEAWGSVSVISQDPFEADALATALFVMGPDEGLKWAEEQQDIAALFVRDSHGKLSIESTTFFQDSFIESQLNKEGIRNDQSN